MTQAPSPTAPATGPAIPSTAWRTLSAQIKPANLPSGLDAAWAAAESRVVHAIPRRGRLLRRAERILKMSETLADVHIDELAARAAELKDKYRLGRDSSDDLDQAFALVREIAGRTLGMRHYREQLAAGLALDRGSVVELATGEGKTLSATLAATVAGWRGKGCHILTVNDYLASRDAEEMEPLYSVCGLTVASVEQETEPPQRRQAYAADITYSTSQNVNADFLRDRIALGPERSVTTSLLGRITLGEESRAGQMVLRGLEYAIVDEADSLLIDEAVTPLILSGDSPNPEQVDAFITAEKLTHQLSIKEDYKVDRRWREVRLTSTGSARLEEICEDLGGIWTGRRRREEMVVQALTAKELYIRDDQYVIQKEEGEEDKVVIVDESTGRLMPDRRWRGGLHQAVAAKEGAEVEPPKITLARLSFQRFFRLYKKLAGMTGTGWEARHEVWQVYRMPVIQIPTHKPCIRIKKPTRIYAHSDDRWQAAAEQVREYHEAGLPVLVGTRSVEESLRISELLTELEVPHQVLNAVNHEEEADIVKDAGQPGRVTVATNMAGRGTDIKLGEGINDLGGLQVVCASPNESARIDRQLYGRAGRQGDNGTAISIISAEDELFKKHGTRLLRAALRSACASGGSRGTTSRFARRLLDRT
ncbi:MAG: prepilin peptidase, partial [Phycisphaerae bacterium]|nr:prepilin peptidase [Phycisphaerae bacterium]